MKKYKATLTRLVEETCVIKIDAKDPAEAAEKAVDLGAEVADLVWVRDDNVEPHTLSVESVQDMAEKENL